jgi:hypothetical protein
MAVQAKQRYGGLPPAFQNELDGIGEGTRESTKISTMR